jgi:hypothetical protein
MDVRSKELFRDMFDAINFKPNSKIKVSQKGIALYSKKRNNE